MKTLKIIKMIVDVFYNIQKLLFLAAVLLIGTILVAEPQFPVNLTTYLTIDAAELPPIDNISVDIEHMKALVAVNLSVIDIWPLLLLFMFVFAAFLYLIHLLRDMLKVALKNEPFNRKSVTSLRIIGLILLIWPFIEKISTNYYQKFFFSSQMKALAQSNISSSTSKDFNFTVFGLGNEYIYVIIAGLIVIAMAEIFRYGIKLQEFENATV